jgi:hypothetical protein
MCVDEIVCSNVIVYSNWVFKVLLQFLLLLFEAKIKTIIITITISNCNSTYNSFFSIMYL